MGSEGGRELVEAILRRNRYLVLSTTDGTSPWVAPLEYMIDDDLNFYVFSTDDSRHVRDLELNIVAAIDALKPPMPPYSVFRIEPRRFLLPEIEDGVNVRTEIPMGR